MVLLYGDDNAVDCAAMVGGRVGTEGGVDEEAIGADVGVVVVVAGADIVG